MARLPTVADLPAAERQRLAALAEAERSAPCAAYDVISLDGAHPLDHLVHEKPLPFFGEIARRAIAELRNPSGKYGGNAATRRRIAADLGLAQDEVAVSRPLHPHRRHAYDQEIDMPPRGAEYEQQYSNGNGGDLSPEDAVGEIQAIIERIEPGERAEFLAHLAKFLDEQGANTAESTNMGALDRSRALDARRARNAAFAQDSALRAARQQSFLERFPGAKNISVWGSGGGR